MRTSAVVVLAIVAAVLVATGASSLYWVLWAVLVVAATALWMVRR
ncbi:hypothetical protein ACWELJ_00865 [Nocardia sp. NPDC004582]